MLFKDIKLLDKDFTVKEHQYVVTEGEYIKYAGPQAQAEDGMEVIDGHNRFLMPAFYNTHCHVPMTLLRGYGEGLPLQEWLSSRVFPFEAKYRAQEKYWGAALGACELIRSGCVSISDMYFDLADYGEALYKAGMKANLSNGAVCFDDNEAYKDNNAYRDTQRLLEWLKDHRDGRIRADASIHSEYCSRKKIAAETAEFAGENGMIIQVHVSETRREVEECMARNGYSPVRYLKECGILEHPAVAAHCVWLDDDDMEILKESGTVIAHNPSSNLKLGSGIPPAAEYKRRGLRVTVGTDGASSNNNLNMMEEMHLAAMLCRGRSLDANAIPAAEILRMCTREGALAQGRTDCGLIDAGMRADLIMFDLDRPHLLPDYDTASNIVFSAQASDIVMTMCDGKVLYKDGQLLTVDEQEIKAKAAESFINICSR